MFFVAMLLTLSAGPQSKDVAADCDALLARYARAGWSGTALIAREGATIFAQGYGPADLEGTRKGNRRAGGSGFAGSAS